MQVGDLVKIRTSIQPKAIGKLAIVMKVTGLSATIFIMDTGKREGYDPRKLELVKKCP